MDDDGDFARGRCSRNGLRRDRGLNGGFGLSDFDVGGVCVVEENHRCRIWIRDWCYGRSLGLRSGRVRVASGCGRAAVVRLGGHSVVVAWVAGTDSSLYVVSAVTVLSLPVTTSLGKAAVGASSFGVVEVPVDRPAILSQGKVAGVGSHMVVVAVVAHMPSMSEVACSHTWEHCTVAVNRIAQVVVVVADTAAVVLMGTSSADDGCLEVHVRLACLNSILALPSLSQSWK